MGTSASGVLLRLVRPDGAADDAFYGDSKAFMDLAIKGLNLRRNVGADQVRLTSLGPALSDTMFVDHYQRKWQERVWAVPFLDMYVVALLLPAPDGYSAIIEYAPSWLRQETLERSRMLADQFTVSFTGTLAQWQAHFARRWLLPGGFGTVKLSATPQWTLQTPRFVSTVPPNLLALTDKSVLTLTMGFVPDGARANWEAEEVWWSRDNQLTESLGLWRRLRPPQSARPELRDGFENMRNRRSPYDGRLNRESGQTYTASTVLDVPGRRPGQVSADLLYGVAMRWDHNPDMRDVALLGSRMATTARVLETGGGDDVATAKPRVSAAASSFDAYTEPLMQQIEQEGAGYGRDIRGHLMSEDLNEYVQSLRPQALAADADAENLTAQVQQRLGLLRKYWQQSQTMMHNRELWSSFLSRNRLPPDTPHGDAVKNAEKELLEALQSGVPSPAWADLATALREAYGQERDTTYGTIVLADSEYQARRLPCPAPATGTSGSAKPAALRINPADFYPVQSKRLGESGSIVVSIRVSASGCALSTAITHSSGSELMDEAVLQMVEAMNFLPAEQDGKAVAALKPLKVTFKLSN